MSLAGLQASQNCAAFRAPEANALTNIIEKVPYQIKVCLGTVRWAKEKQYYISNHISDMKAAKHKLFL